jgi:hypothetical protein
MRGDWRPIKPSKVNYSLPEIFLDEIEKDNWTQKGNKAQLRPGKCEKVHHNGSVMSYSSFNTTKEGHPKAR